VMNKPSVKQVAWSAVIGLGTILALVASIWGIDERYVPREIHKFEIAEVYETMNQVQQTNLIYRAQQDVQYWLRIELQLETLCDQNPNNQSLRRKYNRAVEERKRAEERLRKLNEGN